MSTEQSVNLMWDKSQKGEFYPEELHGKLSMEEAYQVQVGLLDKTVQAGEKQAGWKIGLTADAVRAHFNASAPVYGYLLESRRFPSGHTFTFSEAKTPSIESELCFFFKGDVKGPGATPGSVLDALESVAPAFEVIERRGDMAGQLPLGVADNVSQWSYVVGPLIKPYPRGLDLGAIEAVVKTNGQEVRRGFGRDVIDNQLESLAWLANSLHAVGRHIAAGHLVMSGSFTPPLPLENGQKWETSFSGVGTVSVSFK